MGNIPSIDKTVKNTEKQYVGFETNSPIQEIGKMHTEEIKKEYEQIKKECPPCPKYNFKDSDEAKQIRLQIIEKMNIIFEKLKLKPSLAPILLKNVINELVNSNIKSPIDDISFEILITKDGVLNVIDQEIIDNIIKKGTNGQIKILSGLRGLKNEFKLQLENKLNITIQTKYLKYKKKYLQIK